MRAWVYAVVSLALVACGEVSDRDGGGPGADAGSAGDAGHLEAGPIDPDTGPIDPDAGPIDPDAGPIVPDAGPLAPDAGASGMDASLPIDGGAGSDAGIDAGTSAALCTNGEERACFGGPDGTLGVGRCTAGIERCEAGAWGACSGEVRPSGESCNGADDDCDGATDEGLTAPAASLTAGACAGAVQVCAGPAGFVDPDYTAIAGYQASETGACDGIDNDCDGRADEQHDMDGDGFYAITDPACRLLYRTTGRWDCAESDPSRHACAIYVDADAIGANDGTSWTDAYVTLRDALTSAAAGSEIWIAEGTYHPDRGAGVVRGSRAASFAPAANVAIYGGFAGTEALRSARDPRANVVVLSGDLSGDDGPGFTNRFDNSDHVVTAQDGMILDGVTIRGGWARDGARNGGGVFARDAMGMLIHGVLFEDNVALAEGAGVYLDRSDALIVSSVFRANRAVTRGSAIHLTSSGSITVYNSVFNANTSLSSAAQIAASGGTVRVFSSSFAGYNVAYGVMLDRGTAEVRNSVLWRSGFFGLSPIGTTFTTPGNCLFSSSSAPSPFVDVDGPDDVRGNADDDLRLTQESGCVDAGDAALLPSYLTTDVAGLARVFGESLDDGAHEARWSNGCELGEDCRERCDAVDNDSDGAIDEDPSEMPPCRLAGACSTSMAVCSGGSWTCSYPSAAYMTPSETICGDRIDNDCNGITDELFSCACAPGEDLGRACDGSADTDRCATGALVCSGSGVPQCVGDTGYVADAFVNTRGGYDLDREAPGCAGGTELHVLGVYTTYDPTGDPTPGRLDVEVSRLGAAIVLVLSGNDAIDWFFDVSPGVTLSRVVIHGSAGHTVSGLDPSIPVTYRTGTSAWTTSSVYRYGTVATATVITEAELETGVSLTSFVGTYESNRYTLSDAP